MKNTINLLKILIFTALFMSITQARQPAVDPIQGISIEEYKETKPDTTKGFDFSKSKKETPSILSSNQTKDSDHKSTSSFPVIVIAIFLVIAPFAIWFTVMGRLESKDENIITPQAISLDLERAKRKARNNNSTNDDDDFTLPKAG